MGIVKGFGLLVLGVALLGSGVHAGGAAGKVVAQGAGEKTQGDATGKKASRKARGFKQVSFPATSVTLRAKPPTARPIYEGDTDWLTVRPVKEAVISPFIPLDAEQWYLMEFDAQSSSQTGGRYDFWISQRFGKGGWHSNNSANGYAFSMADDKPHHFELRYYMPDLVRKESGFSRFSVDYYKSLVSGEDASFNPTGISVSVRNRSPLDGHISTLKIRNFTMTPIAQADYRRHAARLRTPFAGSRVRIDALGNWELLREGKWQSYFPLVMYPAAGLSSYRKYRDNGWNTLTQINRIEQAELAAKAGLYYQVDVSSLFANADIDGAVALVKSLKKRAAWRHAVAIYFDLENGTELKLGWAKMMVTALKKALLVDGVQEIPVIANHLAPEAMIPFGDLFDAVGGYVNPMVSPWDKSSTRGTHQGELEAFVTALNSANMKVPVGVGTVNMPHEADHLETVLWAAIARGARGFGYWRDRYDNSDKTDISRRKWYKAFPAHTARVGAVLPLLREPTHPAFRLTMSEREQEWGVIYGTREFKGKRVLIVVYQGSNLEASKGKKTVTFTADRAVGKVRDLFSNKVVTRGEGKQFKLVLKPYEYRVVYLQ